MGKNTAILLYKTTVGCRVRLRTLKYMIDKIVPALTTMGLPKNDDVDAFVIAGKLRFGRITKEVYMDDYRYKALQTLTRFCASRENGDTSCGGTDPAWRHGKGRGIFYAAPSLGLPVHLMVSLLLRTDVL